MDIIFKAELRNIKIVYNFLKSISFRENAIIRVTPDGLKITVEEMKSVQTSAYIPQEFFESFHLYQNEDFDLKISMKVLTEFLNIFGDDGNPCLKIVCNEIGSPLILIMDHDEEPTTADCKLSTMEAEETLELFLPAEDRVNNLLVKAPLFVNIVRELDSSSDSLEFNLSPEEPFFRLSTRGLLGEIHVDISPNSEMIEKFNCKETTKLTYKLGHIKQLERVMNISSRISINIGPDAGLLHLQMIIEPNSNNATHNTTLPYKMYAEFFCTALIEDE